MSLSRFPIQTNIYFTYNESHLYMIIRYYPVFIRL